MKKGKGGVRERVGRRRGDGKRSSTATAAAQRRKAVRCRNHRQLCAAPVLAAVSPNRLSGPCAIQPGRGQRRISWETIVHAGKQVARAPTPPAPPSNRGGSQAQPARRPRLQQRGQQAAVEAHDAAVLVQVAQGLTRGGSVPGGRARETKRRGGDLEESGQGGRAAGRETASAEQRREPRRAHR